MSDAGQNLSMLPEPKGNEPRLQTLSIFEPQAPKPNNPFRSSLPNLPRSRSSPQVEGLGFRGLGFRVLGFRVLGFRV